MQSQDIANLIINKLTQSQFNAITPNETELYLITDSALDSTLSDVSENAVMNKVIKSAIDNKQDLNTAVTHESSTAVGNNVTPVYVNSDGSVATISYTIAKSVPSDAEFTDTVYAIGTGLSLSGNTINHSNSISSGTVGSSTASSGSTVEIPYITYDAQGHITVIGTHTHTVTGFLTEHQDISGKANLSEVYTKSEINGKLSGAMHFKGTQLTVGALSEISDPQVGDMWNVKSTGANYAWDGENWDKLSEKIDLSDYQEKSTAVTHESGSAVGDTITPIYINSNGVANVLNYTIAKSVPSDAEFTDTTYTAGTGISISGTIINHSNSIVSGTTGTSSNTSGNTLEVPYIKYDAQGHITEQGTHVHTITGFLTEHQDISGKANLSELATVAITGSYSDLEGTPTIPIITNTYSSTSENGVSGKAVYDAISELATDSSVVHLNGDESISGNKLFSGDVTFTGEVSLSSTVLAVTPSVSDNSTKIATTEFVKSQGYISNITAGTGISISDDGVISNTQTSAEWGSIIGNLSEQSDLNTVLEGKQLISNLVTSVSSSSTDEQYPSAKLLYDKERVLLGRIWSNVNNPNNGWFTTTYNHNNGSYSQMFNESDGGGSIVFDKTANIISFIGANLEEGQAAGNSAVNIQIYSKDKTTNEGTRLNVSSQGIYYTKNRTSGTYTSSDELVTKADLSEMSGLTVTDNIVESSTDALTSGGAFTNLITSIAANSVSSDSIDIVKANSVSTITINNVANATTSSKLGSTNVGSASAPIYLSSGTPTSCTGIKVGMLKG